MATSETSNSAESTLLAGAPRPTGGAFLRSPLAAVAAAALLVCAARPAAAQLSQDQGAAGEQNTEPPPPDPLEPGADQPPGPPLPAGESQWAGDDNSEFGKEVAPDGEGDAYTRGYQDGKEDGQRDALAEPTHGPTMSDFHQSMDQSGSWEQTQEYGTVWRPAVEQGWRPYTYGNWVYTSYGWTWASTEPWGWATFHYGRWVLLGSVWAWIPGRIWAPAWVSWRWGGGYAGWAPLGPRGTIYWHSSGWWTLVEQRHFLHPIRTVMVPEDRHPSIFAQAHPVRPIYGRVGGPTRTWVGGAVGRPITPTRVETVSHPGQAQTQSGGILRIFAPQSKPIPARPAAQGNGGNGNTGRPSTPPWAPHPGWGRPGSTPPIRNPSATPNASPNPGHAPNPTPGHPPQNRTPWPEPRPNTAPRAEPHGSAQPQNNGVPVQGHQVAPGGTPTHFGGVAIHPAGQPPQPRPTAQPRVNPQPAPRPVPTPAPAPHPKPEHEKEKKK